VTSENIALWKTTAKGPDRLHEALGDHSVPAKLRAEAAVALVDMGHDDEVDTLLTNAPADDRAEIAKSLEPLYEVAMKDPSPDKALAYRDALFSLRGVAPGEDQRRIDDALLGSLEAEMKTGKVRQGRHSLDKMMTAIGAPAGEMLVRVLATPDVPYVPAAEMLGKVGDETARDKGATALVARVPQIRAAEKSPEKLDRALGMIGGPTAVKFLEHQATTGKGDEPLMAARALTERRDPSVLPFALKIASDPKADKALRDEMFGVVEGIGGLEAEKGLLGVISSDKEEIVRYRAFEAMLGARKAEGIVPALEAFPASVAYKKVDVDDLLVKLIEKLGQSARPPLVQALGSHVALARMTAVMTLAHVGKPEDAAALAKLTSDSASIKGFPPGDTIGKEAAEAAAALKKRT
jgi:HEAT repeat protein